MSDRNALQLGLEVLDRQLIDSEGRHCGKVDDVEIDDSDERHLVVTALLIGPAAAIHRLPRWLFRALRPLVGRRVVRVPWKDVASVDAAVTLRRPAAELELGGGDRRAGSWISRLPGAS
ncbi:MAG: PRC-barrel domain-containing protein [Candidatus Dormibacteria bacterium]